MGVRSTLERVGDQRVDDQRVGSQEAMLRSFWTPGSSVVSRRVVASYPFLVNGSKVTRWMAARVPGPGRRKPPAGDSLLALRVPEPTAEAQRQTQAHDPARDPGPADDDQVERLMHEIAPLLAAPRTKSVVLELGQDAGLGDRVVGTARGQRPDGALHLVDPVRGDQQEPVRCQGFA